MFIQILVRIISYIPALIFFQLSLKNTPIFSLRWSIGIASIAIYALIIELFLLAYHKKNKALIRVILKAPSLSDLLEGLLIDSIVSLFTTLGLYLFDNNHNFYVIFSYSLIFSYGAFLATKVFSMDENAHTPKLQHHGNLSTIGETSNFNNGTIVKSTDVTRRLDDIFLHKKINHLKEASKLSINTKRKILKKYRVSPNAKLIAAYDSTVFGTFNCGIAFTNLGIYWKNDIISTHPGNFSISYEDLAKSEISEKNLYQVSIRYKDEEKTILPYVGDQFEPSKDICVLLKIIKSALTELDIESVELLIKKIEDKHKEIVEQEFESNI